MKTFLIHVTDKNIFEAYGLECCMGEIQIGSFKESFGMPLEYWSIQEYEQQWKEGIARLKSHNRTCLVAAVQDPEKGPRADLWVLYKEGEKVYIQNNILFGKRFDKMLKKQPFTLQTCYKFTISRGPSNNPEYKVSEWVVDLKDIIGE